MLEAIILGLFIAGLLLCIALDYSIIFALIFGLVLFFTYGIIKKHSLPELFKMSFSGVKAITNIMFVFMMIGALTAVWRASGAIPFIIYHASKLILPQLFVLAAFILCCGISVLTGTSFGTAATMGVICMMMGKTLGINEFWLGGAILAGAFFGDRCSPMSTSALLVGELTHTSIYENIPKMIKTSLLPFAVTCLIYAAVGLISKPSVVTFASVELFAENFDLIWVCVLPALVIVVLSLARVNVKITIAVSIVVGGIICVAVQNTGFKELINILVFGYKAQNPELARMMNGGGLVSMLLPTAIVCISACYSGIFEGTGMLESTKKLIAKVSTKITPFGGLAVTSILTGMIGCNQTLAIMLSQQLCKDTIPDEKEMAISLENSAVVISPLIPWSIAGAVPLAAVSAPVGSILFACYLYFLPLFNWVAAAIKERKKEKVRVK